MTAAFGNPVVPDVYMYKILSEKFIESETLFATESSFIVSKIISRSTLSGGSKTFCFCSELHPSPEQKDLNDR